MRTLKVSLFVLAILLSVELSFRVYLYGVAAINPVKMDSFNQIHYSGMVRAAKQPGVLFELKPDLHTWYKGVRFNTNSVGQRDREYSKTKPANTFRVVVLGSSWTMGSGVKAEDTWDSQLEARLNKSSSRLQYEFINFAVDQYGLGEIVATLENKALDYDPDLIVVALTYFTPTLLWPEPGEPYIESPRRHPFFDLHSLRVLDQRLGLHLYPPEGGKRETVTDRGKFNAQLRRAAIRFEQITHTSGVPLAIAKLAYTRGWNKTTPGEAVYSLAEDRAYTYMDVTEKVRSAGYAPGELSVSVWDSHPNRLAHGLIADAVLDVLLNKGLLPNPQN